jgi:hypothetical protein
VSYSKRVLFGDDPADDAIRQQMAQRMEQWLEPFKFTVPTRRRNRRNVGLCWDSWWPADTALGSEWSTLGQSGFKVGNSFVAILLLDHLQVGFEAGR